LRRTGRTESPPRKRCEAQHPEAPALTTANSRRSPAQRQTEGGPEQAREQPLRARIATRHAADGATAQYEAFMKLAGPYWMSCVTKNEDLPTFDPDHYRSYLDH
jgi:hypothetical protein